jgi:hypothetical protein
MPKTNWVLCNSASDAGKSITKAREQMRDNKNVLAPFVLAFACKAIEKLNSLI